MNFNGILDVYKTARSKGLGFRDICSLINFAALEKLGEKLKIPILVWIGKIGEMLCQLAPDKQAVFMTAMDAIAEDQPT